MFEKWKGEEVYVRSREPDEAGRQEGEQGVGDEHVAEVPGHGGEGEVEGDDHLVEDPDPEHCQHQHLAPGGPALLLEQPFENDGSNADDGCEAKEDDRDDFNPPVDPVRTKSSVVTSPPLPTFNQVVNTERKFLQVQF